MIEPRFVSDDYSFSNRERALAQTIATDTECEVRNYLPDLSEHITLVIRAGTRVIPEVGAGGFAHAAGEIHWTVDPSRLGGVEAIMAGRLRHALFHECHHLARGWVGVGGPPSPTLMDSVVAEGLATVFERDAAGSHPPWGDYPPDVGSWVSELVDASPSVPYAHWMFLHPDGRRWIGYRAGTYIADQAVKRSGMDAAVLASVLTADVLAIAGVR